MTRSTHKQENESIVQEMSDILGTGWRLEPVLPELTDDRVYDYEIGMMNLI